ncbi:hypothetical protein ACROYT_G031725 [Oculina patagonica]
MDVTRMKQDIFMPQETQDNPFDITLVVEDGTEFKAHRKVLSEASFFFEKLLNSDMMESKKGVVRLEMLTGTGLRAVLEFIYTGDVQILTEDDARDLIEMADYLFILPLKTLAGKVLAQALNTSNCIPTNHFAKRYQCEELVSDAKKFIYANFTNEAKAEEFLNMSNEEVYQWISSDEINVSAEENVFKIILTWINHSKSEREKYFADLFRQVRLIYVSRDYLLNDIMTNDLVNDNACCLNLVKDAMKAVDSKNSENVSFPPPRKSLETPVIVVSIPEEDPYEDHFETRQLLCYVPRTNTWYKLRDTSPWADKIVSCHGKLFTFYSRRERDYKLSRYDSFFARWTHIPYKGKRDLQQIFVSDNNAHGIYALESENEISCPDCVCLYSRDGRVLEEFFYCGKQHLTYITRYKPELNSWEKIATFDLGLPRTGICIVAKDNFIYFMGGQIWGTKKVLADFYRYDLNQRKWDKLADLQEARREASGAAVHRNIFIAGGWSETYKLKTCEVYNDITNEWQSIARSSIVCRSFYGNIMCVDDKVYAVKDCWDCAREQRGEIECYDPDKNEWNVITKIPVSNVLRERTVFGTT